MTAESIRTRIDQYAKERDTNLQAFHERNGAIYALTQLLAEAESEEAAPEAAPAP